MDTVDNRFRFGNNWNKFLEIIDEDRIESAIQSLKERLGVSSLEGKRFLDIGSGSGLFSLAAHRLGAIVHSFDFDIESVNCAKELKHRYSIDDEQWKIEQGSVLDINYLHGLGKFEIVYAWGVLHHTGSMWRALHDVICLIEEEGYLFISIYNDQRWLSKMWLYIKRIYNKMPKKTNILIEVPAFVALWGPNIIKNIFVGSPFKDLKNYYNNRGMSPWYDLVDWIGGYPFEVAKPDVIVMFYIKNGFTLKKLVTCGGGLGCNEFVFKKSVY